MTDPRRDKVPAELADELEAARTRAMTLRLRTMCQAGIIVPVAFFAANAAFGNSPAPYTAGLRVIGIVFFATLTLGTYSARFVPWQNLAAMAAATLGYAAMAFAGIALENFTISALGASFVLWAVSAFLPWTLRYHMTNIALMIAVLATAALATDVLETTQTVLPTLTTTSVGCLLALFISVQSTRDFDGMILENLRAVRAEDGLRTLNDELETRVEERTKELDAALSDQRAMTRAISHDLRQPLRHINGFTQFLSEDGKQGGGTIEPEDVRHVRIATARMDRMVDALLEISRVGGAAVVRERIDLAPVVRAAMARMRADEPARSLVLEVPESLETLADGGLTRALLGALLANAWKFTRRKDPARIEVGHSNGSFFVKDNGSGFDPAHAEKIFALFERMHRTDEFEGEGVGLAIADRIVRRHGGRIWVESTPGGGTTFYFTLAPEMRADTAGAMRA